MKKIILSIGCIFIAFSIFGQPGCVQRKIDYSIPDTCKVIFSDSGESEVSIVRYGDRQDYLHRKETKYSIFENYLVKSEKVTKYLIWTNGEGSSSYTLTFFEMPDYKKAFTCNKNADLFQPESSDEPYLVSEKLGCCEYANYYELSTFPENKVFLSYHRNRFEVHAREYANSMSKEKYVIYFGYDKCQQYLDSTEAILGALNYSINQKYNGSVVFKKKNPKDKIYYSSSKIQLIENGEVIGESANNSWKNVITISDNLNYLKNYSEINNLGVMVTFNCWKENERFEKEYKIEFVNGTIKQNEILVEL